MIAFEPIPGWKGEAVHGERMTLTSYTIAAGAPDVHEHQHPEEEAWTVLEGELALWVDGEECVLRAGDVAVVGPNVRHRVRALGASRALVIDTPPRRPLPGTGH
jgi:quercetin dioxygenase-like cupin family protein